MITLLVALSSVLTIASVVPYIVAVVRGKTKPRVVSWFTWSLLTGVACVATLADKQYPAAILLGCGTFITALVVVLGWRYGNRKFERFDIICQLGVFVGLILWFVFNSPAIAVIATVVIDLIGGLPTIKHAWQKPHEETWITFAMNAVAGLCTVLAAGSWQVTAILFPLYLTGMNSLLTTIILARHKYAVRGVPAELREL